ncbi:abscisic acid 8'-hydroxylase 3-like [Selaginella moellendorffii]|uniref:abscisic acid 8'-hydroxylase 3-like n=1 Tax=Selaginella moellendorffii TaxID=88036 RepID=UPI000D1CF28D|nr:abscisic acid 8'-hydroxylase 3-like [Selaginella moellendorffii]|eukprot:XP_024543815.1 abscisic acid 8'-hydroxylase 3-like [Selaginella moellendorffii]
MALWSLYLLLVIPAVAAFLISSKRKSGSMQTPPGNRGLPILGETIQLLRGTAEDFVFQRRKRFGDIFSAHLFGRQSIVISTPEAVKFFLTNPGARNCCSPSNSGFLIVGKESVGYVEGATHARYHRAILSSMSGDALKNHVQRFDKIAMDLLTSWQRKGCVTVLEETLQLTFDVVTAFICDDPRIFQTKTGDFMHDVTVASRGLFKLPINLPFTDYHRALQARKRLHYHLDRLINERRISKITHDDLLHKLMNDEDLNSTNQQIEDNIVGLLFAGQHTTPLTLEEHQKILREREQPHLTWEDTRRMPVTMRVLQETLRSATGGMLVREMKHTVEYNGYVFPKGWTLHIFHTAIHLNEDYFADPYKFDPSRFLVPQKPGTLIGFGCGLRTCPGAELAKLEILVFFHRLVTQYSWKPKAPNGAIRNWPLRIPEDGYVVEINRK